MSPEKPASCVRLAFQLHVESLSRDPHCILRPDHSYLDLILGERLDICLYLCNFQSVESMSHLDIRNIESLELFHYFWHEHFLDFLDEEVSGHEIDARRVGGLGNTE